MDRGIDLGVLGFKDNKLSEAEFVATMGMCFFFRQLSRKGVEIFDTEVKIEKNKKLKTEVPKIVHEEHIMKVCVDTALGCTGTAGGNSTRVRNFLRQNVIPVIINKYTGTRISDEEKKNRSLLSFVNRLLDPDSESPFYVFLEDDLGELVESTLGKDISQTGLFEFYDNFSALLEKSIVLIPFNNLFAGFMKEGILQNSSLVERKSESFSYKTALAHCISLEILLSMGKIYKSMGGYYYGMSISIRSLVEAVIPGAYDIPLQRDVVVFGEGLENLRTMHPCHGSTTIGDFVHIDDLGEFKAMFFNVKGALSARNAAIYVNRFYSENSSRNYVVVILKTMMEKLVDDISGALDHDCYSIEPDIEQAEMIRLYDRYDQTDIDDLIQAVEFAGLICHIDGNQRMTEFNKVLKDHIVTRLQELACSKERDDMHR